MEAVIRRTVSIPKVVYGNDILAIIEVGGEVFTKDTVYQKFFEHGVDAVKKDILEEIKKKGGTETDFKKMLEKARKFSKS